MSRLSRDEWALRLALVTAERTTCLRRAVGCVLLSARGFVLATGYNGVAAGLPHCNDFVLDLKAEGRQRVHPHACKDAAGPVGSNGCEAIHAEQNALLQCRDAWSIDTAYVTTSPCLTCCKLLLNTSCRRIVFVETHQSTPASEELWTRAGRLWEQLELPSKD